MSDQRLTSGGSFGDWLLTLIILASILSLF